MVSFAHRIFEIRNPYIIVSVFCVCYITNSHKLDGLKQKTFILSQSKGQRSEISIIAPKSGSWQGCAPSQAQEENLFFASFMFLVAASILWLMVPSL